MWGCLKTLTLVFAGGALLLLLLFGGGWWYLGTTSFEDLVRLRVEETLEAKLGREVTIGEVHIVRSRPQKVILRDLRIANAPGGVARSFATVAEVEISGGIESFWRRTIRGGRIDGRDPRLWFEGFPRGSELVHNFPKWKTGPPRRYEIVRLAFGQLQVANGEFHFLDRRHEITAVATKISSRTTITRAEGLYEGLLTSPLMRVRIQDYEPFDVRMRGGFRYTPGTLALRSIALEGDGIQTFLSGTVAPVSEAKYDMRLVSRLALGRIREIFRLESVLAGDLALDTRLRGKSGDFELTGRWSAPKIAADAYELAGAQGRMAVDGDRTVVDVERAGYGGGNISAHYVLSKYAEPYPMTADLRYQGISVEQLFEDWDVKDTGLRGGATGTLTYRWNKDDLLLGSGEGSARLAKSAVAFSNARYAIPLAGTADFSLDRGVVRFRRAELDTDASQVGILGTFRIEGAVTDLQLSIRSTDFAELDRVGYNLAHSADKADYELLGLGGSGTIEGTLRGPIEAPHVAATISASGARFNEVLLGSADIALRYDGDRSVMTFERAAFREGGGVLTLTGTLSFPDSGPAPLFDIAVEANGYPAQRAIDAVELDLKIGAGLATGKMIVAGNGENGRVTFAGLRILRAEASLALDGTAQWFPGEGNVVFDLAVTASDFPVADIATFLDFADLPVTGDLTGSLNLRGPKSSLEGSGSVVVRRGKIADEPVELASADIEFTQGRMRATNVLVRTAAGEVSGEADLDLGKETFSYTISSDSIDLSKLEALSGVRDLLGGQVVLRSTGAGTFDQPELVAEATLEGATLRGLELPAGSPPPSLYLAIRGGRLVVRGGIADIVSIEGDGSVGEKLAVDGLVRVTVADVARALALSPATASFPATGKLVIDLRLGGAATPIEALVIEATVPVFDIAVAEHQFTTRDPIRISLRGGSIEIGSFAVQSPDSSFTMTGGAEVTGAKRIDLDVRGRVEAALLQLFARDVRADGNADVALGIEGSLEAPALTGTIDLVDAEIRFAGFPQLIDEINGRIVFRPDRVQIDSLHATVGGGRVVAGGFADLEGLKPTRMRVTLQGSEVAIRYYDGVTLESNFTLLLNGDMERMVLQGDIDVTRGLYYRDFELQEALLEAILARDRVTAVTGAGWQDRLVLDLRLNAPGTLAIRNNIAEVTGSAALEVKGTLATPVILGEVTLDEGGTVRLQNVDYRVTRGTIAFQNPFRIDPFIDVTIEGTVSGGTSELEGGPLDVTVNLTGTLDRLTPSITSDPPASDITLFSILGFGGLAGRTGGQQAGGVGIIGQSLLSQSLSSLIGSRVFPFVDTFAFDPGTLGTGAGSGAKVTFEKRLSNKIRFLIVYNLDNNQSREVVEWTVNRDWTVQLTRDETDEYRLDARFRRRYDARWNMGDEEESFARAAVMRPAGSAGTPAAATVPRLPAVTAVNPAAFAGTNIAQIDFRADAQFDTSTIAREVALAPGQPITIRALQSSIKNLYATGNFRDIRVDAAEGPSGEAILTFALFLHYRVGGIEIEGLQRRDQNRAERELTVRKGEVLSLDDVDDSALAIQEMLHARGYLEATVDPETNFDRPRSLADIVLHATPGRRAIVGQVALEGDLGAFTPAQLTERMSRKPGQAFEIEEAREDAARIRNFLVRRHFRRADVDYLGHTYDDDSARVALRYHVSVGPLVQVAVAGVPRRTVSRWLPFARNQEYSEDVIDRAADDMVHGLQERGHFLATVDTESELQDGVWTSTFHVDPGPRFHLTTVEFTGNEKVADGELRGIVTTSARGGFRRLLQSLFRRRTGVTREQLSEDRDAIESTYRLQGFSEAVVAEPVVATQADGSLRVAFPVEEGPQTLVSELRIEGNESLPTDDLPRPRLAAGEPLNPQTLREDVVAIQTEYAERGYSEVQVAPRVEISEDRTAARVSYVVTEGPRVEIGEVIVRGNTYTDRDVVLRKAEIEQGDPFTYTSILEAQRELYRLGIFQRVEIQAEQTGTSVADRQLVIDVQEGKNLTLTGAIGLRAQRGLESGSGLAVHERLAGAVAHRNLFGTGRYLGLETVLSSDEREGFLTYREPFVSKWNVPVQFQIFQSDDATRPGTPILQRGSSVEITKVARRQTRWSIRYEYKISQCKETGELCDELRAGEIEGIDRSLLDIQISSITPTFFWDRRDDIIDPHRGFFTSASVEQAFPMFSNRGEPGQDPSGATAHFLKEYVQGAFYLPVSDRTVFAFAGRVGLIQPQGGTTHQDVALSERFTAGGETTHRAFRLDLLGDLCRDEDYLPVDKDCEATLFKPGDDPTRPTLPKGGSGLLLLNAEYRFPIFGTFGGAIFADAGNVFRSGRIRFDRLRYGVGLGFRYLSPVGPLRIDIGWPLDRKPFEDPFQYFITLGYPF